MPLRPDILSLGHDPVLLAARHSLLAAAGYRVTSAADPNAALQLMYTRRFDLLVAGCMGVREADLIEQTAKRLGTPILLLYCRVSDAGGDRQTCADVFNDPAEILARVAALLSCVQVSAVPSS